MPDEPQEVKPSKFVTVQEAMEILGIARSTIDLRVRQGKLKRFQASAPKRTMYLREQVVKLKEEVIPKPPTPERKKPI